MLGTAKKQSRGKYLTAFGAWAFAFGCAIGWDAFLMPEASFLPKAGPVGTILGLLIGGLAMAVIAWNYHVMMNRHPGIGGAYTYASEEFGRDHGYVCAWFLCLVYLAIMWMDATVIAFVAQYVFGERALFGFSYTVHGNEVYLCNVAMSIVAIVVAMAVCFRRRLAAYAQTVVAVVCALGIVVAFVIAASNHVGGTSTLGTCFLPGDTSQIMQVMQLLAISPLMFIGFETVSNLSSEFSFNPKKSFGVMAAALVSAICAYALLTVIPVLCPPQGCATWLDMLAFLPDKMPFATLDAVKRSAGAAGLVVIAVSMLGLIFTNLIGNTIAVTRLVAAMANDGALPRWLGGRNRDGTYSNAVVAVAVLSIGVSFIGISAISVITDVAIIGASIAYGYTSVATFRWAKRTGSRLSRFTGACGALIALLLAVSFVVPAFSEHSTMIAPESYLAVVIWSIMGLVAFFAVFRRERGSRFGHSSIVWIFMLSVILSMSMIWVRQKTYDTTEEAFKDIVQHHGEMCIGKAAPPATGDATAAHDHKTGDWQDVLMGKLSNINRSILRNSVVQFALTVMAFALTLGLYATLRRREREMDNEKARAKSYFFSTVSHDIRTPLNAILGFSEMLRAGMDTEAERDQALDAIILSGKTLLGLINDILDLSKLESGKMDILPEPTDCKKTLSEIMDAMRVTAHRSSVELRCNIGDMPPLMLDPQRIRQIVFNLVGNAVKFTDKGYVELRAAYEHDAASATGELRIEVEDTGCGISDEDKKYIGKAYVQVGSKVSRNGGTGLGLTICNQLATAMGGRLSFSSTLGRGSTFTVCIPSVRVASDEDCKAAQGVSFVEQMPRRARHAAFKIHRILIVDDSQMNVMVMKAFLHHLGNFDAVSASDGLEALKILKDPNVEPFDLVLTDLWMPNLDGRGLAAEIRKDHRLASLIIVGVTADVELRDSLENGDFTGVIFKPVTCDKLRQTISEMERRLSHI